MSIPFKTTTDQLKNLASITVEMAKVGVPEKFIDTALAIASFDQGVYDYGYLARGKG